MIFLILAGFIFLCCISVCFRLTVLHPFLVLYNAVRDLILYILHCGWRNMHTGELICYTALFGKGKTLSVVHYVAGKYHKYNNQKIYDIHRKKWVTQRVHVISNVHLNGIPYERFESLEQIVSVAERWRKYDEKHDTLTCTLVLGDEFSVQMNSREFKKNIDPLFLNTLLTCRHHHITIVYDAQRFNHVDALLRQVTSYVMECDKIWRYMVQYKYDAYSLECATDPSLVRCQKKTGWFIRDRDFARYDTLACVGNLTKTMKNGGMLSEEEILSLQCNRGTDMDGVVKPSRKYRRMKKKVG